MPCKDTSSFVEIRLDMDDRLIDFDYSKITCGKSVGGTGYRDLCAGKEIRKILEWDWLEVRELLKATDPEEEFLLFLEWSALYSGLRQYLGEDSVNEERYQIASIEYDAESVTIRQMVRPPEDLPKVESCLSRSRRATN